MIRALRDSETESIGLIDRTETITSSYRMESGELQKYEHETIVAAWDPDELNDIVLRTASLISDNGIAIGYFSNTKMVGVATLGSQKLDVPSNYHLMDIFYVSKDYRGHGVGREMFEVIKRHAIHSGASGVYISATPTSETVEFYLQNGCRLTTPNSELLKKEPNDIHLGYAL